MSDFYEDDEPIEKIKAAFVRGEKGRQSAPWVKVKVQPPEIVGLVVMGPPVTKLRARAGRGGHYTDQRTVDAENRLILAIRQTHPGIQPDLVHAFGLQLKFFVSDYRRGDIDNFCKLVLDSMNKIVFGDDQQVLALDAEVFRGDANPRTEIHVSQLERLWRNPTRRS